MRVIFIGFYFLFLILSIRSLPQDEIAASSDPIPTLELSSTENSEDISELALEITTELTSQSSLESNSESNTESDLESNTESDLESNIESSSESNIESSSESNIESSSESNIESSSESNTDSSSESNTDSSSESNTDSSSEFNTDSSSESELETTEKMATTLISTRFTREYIPDERTRVYFTMPTLSTGTDVLYYEEGSANETLYEDDNERFRNILTVGDGGDDQGGAKTLKTHPFNKMTESYKNLTTETIQVDAIWKKALEEQKRKDEQRAAEAAANSTIANPTGNKTHSKKTGLPKKSSAIRLSKYKFCFGVVAGYYLIFY